MHGRLIDLESLGKSFLALTESIPDSLDLIASDHASSLCIPHRRCQCHLHRSIMHNAYMDESMPAQGARLIEARLAALGPNSTAADGARKVKQVYSTYKNHEAGERGFKRSASRYATAYGVRLQWLWSGKGPMREGAKELVVQKYEALTPENRSLVMDHLDFLISRQKPGDNP